jgi:DNA replication and repair protein RecF
MRLEALEVVGCRNLKDLQIELAPGLNLLVGANGAGKTSVLEGVYLLARGRSFRTARIGQVISWGQESLLVRARLWLESRGQLQIGLQRHRSDQASLKINGEIQRQLSAVSRLLPVQLMLPDAAALVLGEPAGRRSFLDWGMFHVEHRYLELLRDYQRALRQRNALLRQAEGQSSRLGPDFEAWTQGLVSAAEQVTELRQRYLVQLEQSLMGLLAQLAPELEISISLSPGWPEQKALSEVLVAGLPREVKSGLTAYGPHRADLRLKLGGELASAALSRGQAKILASALHLAQAQLTARETGLNSLFLIDDLGAELDGPHNRRFFEVLAESGSQVLATAIETPDLSSAFSPEQRRVFHVEQGRCRPAAVGL